MAAMRHHFFYGNHVWHLAGIVRRR
jgi:hypothetical protein